MRIKQQDGEKPNVKTEAGEAMNRQTSWAVSQIPEEKKNKDYYECKLKEERRVKTRRAEQTDFVGKVLQVRKNIIV